MVKVVARTKGVFGGAVREIGDTFDVPDDLWKDEKRRPKWVSSVKFGGKGDHDGDGKIGGSVPAGDADVTVPADWKGLNAAGKKELAKAISGTQPPTARDAEEVIEAYLDANKPETFGEAPAPETVQGNGVKEALGTPPDWVAPGHIEKPVPADD